MSGRTLVPAWPHRTVTDFPQIALVMVGVNPIADSASARETMASSSGDTSMCDLQIGLRGVASGGLG
jgi:hypothetical protein